MLFTSKLSGTDDIKDKISFFKAQSTECPICETEIQVEEFKIGGGRLNAGVLQEDLFRPYLPSDEFGNVFPLLYAIGTCHKCYFSAFWNNFKMRNKSLKAISTKQAQDNREKAVRHLFRIIPNFKRKKTLLSGLASYILAIESYSYFMQRESPSIHQAICCIRGAWLANLLEKYEYGDAFGYLGKMFYKKALFYYAKAIANDTAGVEPLSNMKFLGPDVDQDYGYDGMIYLQAWLEFNYGSRQSTFIREEKLSKVRSGLSRVFGFGRSSKEKPSILLSIARSTYEAVEAELKRYV